MTLDAESNKYCKRLAHVGEKVFPFTSEPWVCKKDY